MKVIVCDLKETGARWLFLGDKVLVDREFIGEYIREYPEQRLVYIRGEHNGNSSNLHPCVN